MSNAIFNPPAPINEPVKSYAPGSSERTEIKAELQRIKDICEDIPNVVDGKQLRNKDYDQVVSPHQHKRQIAKAWKANESDVNAAIESSVRNQKEWTRLPWEERAAVFLKAADLLSTKYRAAMNAATMVGQSKTVFQAEIDAACELADFWRFNVHYMQQIYSDQPYSPALTWNRTACRGLEGFVFAIAPFNFTSIALNLPTAPALMGCGVVWKPAPTSLLGCWVGQKILEEAGLPPGVINLVHGDPQMIGNIALNHRDLAGVHFTGSTGTFNHIWQTIGKNVAGYRAYPRIVGETGGKDFIFAHPSADRKALVTAMVRGAFEFQGQKCSAASRAYVPASIWKDIKDDLIATTNSLKMGDPEDFSQFMGAVIDKRAYTKIKGYIDQAKADSDADVIAGGECDDSVGYFIRPTVIQAKTPKYRTMCEEIFGPVLTVYVYDDSKVDETLAVCDSTSPYALTGAIFARDRYTIAKMTAALENAAGNFYINDKPTGAVVGQQPFGGSRASGTNDKAGSKLNLLRWMNLRTMKENFVPPVAHEYPHMAGS
jgi:1-pyrroline-5-carboxylate dehydrogenase